MPEMAKIGDRTEGATVHQTNGHNGPILNREDFLFFVGQMEKLHDEAEALRKKRNQIRRAAKNSGVELKDMDWAMKMRNQDPGALAEELQRRAQYASYLDMAGEVPSDLFAAAERRAQAEDVSAQAERDGYDDGVAARQMETEKKDGKWMSTTPEGQKYITAYYEGQKVNYEKLRALNAEVAAAERKDAARKARAAEPGENDEDDETEHADHDAENLSEAAE